MKLVIFWLDILHYHAARIAALVEVAAEHGHEVHAFAVRASSPEFPLGGYHEDATVPIEVLLGDSSRADMTSFAAKEALLARLESLAPDAVAIIGYDNRTVRAALGWCRSRRRGAILMFEANFHDFSRSWWKERLKRTLVSFYDSAICGGSSAARYLRKLGVADESIFYYYDVVDNDFWSTNADAARAGAPALMKKWGLRRPFFLTSCRLVTKKNVSTLIAAYDEYVRTAAGETWDLVIAGSGVLEAELRAQIASADLKERVYLVGYLDAHRLAELYGLASAFVLPSLQEQWGLVVNEAMAAALPVLVSSACGCAEDLVRDGETGYTFDPNRPSELTELLTRISADAVTADTLGATGRKRILEYSTRSFAENIFRASEAAMRRTNGRARLPWPRPALWW